MSVHMNTNSNPSLSRRFFNTLLVSYAVAVVAIAPVYYWNENAKNGNISWLSSSEQALELPNHLVEALGSPKARNPLAVKAETEMQKFNLIWFYLANVNRSMAVHQHHYSTSKAFLAACHNFDDFIASLSHMIYASRALNVHTLNSIYPELGNRFQKSYIKGASLMLAACIEGSENKYVESRITSDDWFNWYEANGVAIEKSLKLALK